MEGLRQQAQAFVEDVLRGVDVPVVDGIANRASPFPHREVFRSGPLSTAYRAKLAGGIEAVYRDHLLSIPCRLVYELPPELAPACVRD